MNLVINEVYILTVMNKKNIFDAALTLMCAIVFSVCIGSCEKNDVDNQDDANSLVLNIDTNGVSMTLKPYINWGTSLTDVNEYMAKNYPDYKLCDDGELALDSVNNIWYMGYQPENGDSVSVIFYFQEESGNDLVMTVYHFHTYTNVNTVRNELKRSGLNYKGLINADSNQTFINYVYLSADETLEAQLVQDNRGRSFWGISFQVTDKADLNYLIDESDVNFCIKNDTCTYSLIPFVDWDAAVADVKQFMTENYPDWEIYEGGKLFLEDGDWALRYEKDCMTVYYYFADEIGTEFTLVQFNYYGSTDISQAQLELTRNGLVYLGKEAPNGPEQISAIAYAPLSKNYIVSLESWDLYGGCWCMNIFAYDEDFINKNVHD